MGRSTRYSAEIAEKVIAVLGTGVSYTTAAEYCGIKPKTLHSWIDRKSDFAEKCKRAKASAAVFIHRQEIEAARNGEAWAIKGFLDREERRRQNRENIKIKRAELELKRSENVSAVEGLPPTPQEYVRKLDDQFAFEEEPK